MQPQKNHYKTKQLRQMYLNAEKKREIFSEHGTNPEDTGRSESQIALFSYRINHLTEHLKQYKNDHGTRRALLKLVSKRRRLLRYLKDNDIERYREVIKKLGLRK